MRTLLVVILFLTGLSYSCKSKKTTNEPHNTPIIVLLKDGIKPKSMLGSLTKWNLSDIKPTSRSQNLWSFNCNCSLVEAQVLISELAEENQVISAKIAGTAGKATNSSSSKRVKTKPIRNK